MAVDTTLPNGEPGVASFASETFGNLGDVLFGDTPSHQQISQSLRLLGASASRCML